MASKKPTPDRCRAKLRGSNPPRFCERYPMPNGRCHLHGGKSLKGPASATYQGKGFSKYFPSKKLGDIFTRSFQDQELTFIRKDLAIVETRLVELVQSLSSEQSGTLWKQLRKKHRDLKRSNPHSAKAAKLHNEIGDLIQRGSSDHFIWKEIGQQIELRRRLLDSEIKRGLAANTMYTSDEVRMMADLVMTVIRTHVKDPQTLQKVAD